MTPSETAAARTRAKPSYRLHRFTLLFEAIRIARALVFPAIVGALGATDDDIGRTLAVGLGILAVPALFSAVAKYASFRYRIDGGELQLDSGVLFRRHRVVPLARVQNIDVRQNWLQRIARVAELRIETAGGQKTEAVLSVLSLAGAGALRATILEGRRAAVGPAAAESAAAAPEPERLARLTTADLVLAGATANEAGLIAAGVASALQLLEDVLTAVPLPSLDPARWAPQTPGAGVAIVLALVSVLVIIPGWLLSILGAVIGYHGFTLERAGGILRKRYGLLGRREAAVPLARVQLIRVEESLLRRPLGLAVLKVETAGAAPGQRQRGGAEAFLPLARVRDVPRLAGAVFGDLDYGALRFRPVHPRARRRLFLRYSAPLVLVAGGLALALGRVWLLLLLAEPLLFLLAHAQYRNMGYALVPGYAAARAGFFNRITWLIPDRKVQTLHLKESPLQRRHDLATVVIDTAGGGRSVAHIEDLARDAAVAVLAELERRTTRSRVAIRGPAG